MKGIHTALFFHHYNFETEPVNICNSSKDFWPEADADCSFFSSHEEEKQMVLDFSSVVEGFVPYIQKW